MLNLINKQKDIDKIYVYANEYLIKNRENAGIKYLNDSKAFIKCSNTMDGVYKSIDDYNPTEEEKY